MFQRTKWKKKFWAYARESIDIDHVQVTASQCQKLRQSDEIDDKVDINLASKRLVRSSPEEFFVFGFFGQRKL